MAKIRIPRFLALPTSAEGEESISGNTIGEVLEALCQQHPDLRRQLFNDDGRLRSFVNVYLNDEDVRYLDKENTLVNEGDSISLVPAIAGGPGTNIDIPGAVPRDASVDVLVEDEAPADAQLRNLEAAVVEFMGALGFNLGFEDQPVRGSWFKRFRFHSRTPLSPEDAYALYERAERALRDAQETGGRAPRPTELSRVAHDLIAAVEPFDNVTLRLGNLLLMKATAKGKRKLFLEVMPQARTDELDGDQNKLRRAGQQECLPSWAAPSVDVRERQTSEGSRPHLMGRESIDRDTRIRQLYFQLPEDDTAQGKGAVLEELTCEVFSSIPGFVVIDRNSNTKTEEIDLVIRNEGTDLRWRSESALILVECKNWHTRRVGKNEFVLFKEKLQNRYGRAKLGFLICTEHFAETADIERLRSSKSDFLIVLIDSDGLEQLVRSGDRGSTLRQFTDRATLA